MRDLIYVIVFALVALAFAFVVFVAKAQVIDLSAGQLPVLVSTSDLKVAELKCPSNAVLVIQVKGTHTALVSCPPDFLVAPAATLLSADFAVQQPSPLATVDLMPTATTEIDSGIRTLVLQPEGLTGVDTYVDESDPNTHKADEEYIQIDTRSGQRSHGLMYFDLREISNDSVVISATLTLYNSTIATEDIPFTLHTILANELVWWNEYSTWGYAQPGIIPWAGDDDGNGGANGGSSIAEIDYTSLPFGRAIYLANTKIGTAHVLSLDVASIQGWLSDNRGFILRANDGEALHWYSSDSSSVEYRPRLEVVFLERH